MTTLGAALEVFIRARECCGELDTGLEGGSFLDDVRVRGGAGARRGVQLDSPRAILHRAAHGRIGLAVILGCQLRSCAARRRDVAGREGGRLLLITQEAVFTLRH